jgi:hypothetical protein
MIKKRLQQGLIYIALTVAAFAAYVFVINMPLPQNEFDVAILEKTVELLNDEGNWSKMDDRTCGPEKRGLSLYCALRQASIDVTGEFKHRAASLQEVRYAIERRNPDVEYAHRLMDYNNDDFTTFPEMHAMLQEALIMLKKKERPAD